MEKTTPKSKTSKGKAKKQAPKPKNTKKKKSDGPTCSMFLAELTRKLALKKKQEDESSHNVVQSIIESLTNALPITFTRKAVVKKSPPKIEDIDMIVAPELMVTDSVIPMPLAIEDAKMETLDTLLPTATSSKGGFKMPKMPLVSSEVLKMAAIAKRQQVQKEDMATNTGTEHDVASELTKHVNTLKKISLIAEEFNQKTARNLKEIVDSVQEDLIKKLEEIQAEQKQKESHGE